MNTTTAAISESQSWTVVAGRVVRTLLYVTALFGTVSRTGRAQTPSPPSILWLPVGGYPGVVVAAPVVLVHGGNAQAATWTQFGTNLSQNAYGVLAPNLLPASDIWKQADTVRSRVAQDGFFNTPNLSVVGHSQGGLVSRAAIQSMPIRTLVTIGSPHLGMPFAVNKWKINDQLSWAQADFIDLFNLQFPAGYADWDPVYWYRATISQQGITGAGFILSALADQYLRSMWGQQASWDQLAPQSTFLSNLNNTVQAEQVQYAYSIVADESYGYAGGPFRLMYSGSFPNDAAATMYWIGTDLRDLGFNMLDALWGYGSSSEPQWFFDLLGAMAALDLGQRLQTWGPWWNYEVVGEIPNDGLIPTNNQLRPSSIRVPLSQTAHTQETNSIDAQGAMKALLDQHKP